VTYRTLCRRCRRYADIGHAYRRWYRVARGVIGRLADHHMNVSGDAASRVANTEFECVVKLERTLDAYRTLCDVVAITSPRCSVKRNLRTAWGEYAGHGLPHDVIRSTRRAMEHYWSTGEIRGAKTSRFARVLRGDDSVCVVDTWMARGLSIPDNDARLKSTQKLAERVIGHVARAHRCPMAEGQAMVWAGIIRTHYKDGKIPCYRVTDALGSVPF